MLSLLVLGGKGWVGRPFWLQRLRGLSNVFEGMAPADRKRLAFLKRIKLTLCKDCRFFRNTLVTLEAQNVCEVVAHTHTCTHTHTHTCAPTHTLTHAYTLIHSHTCTQVAAS